MHHQWCDKLTKIFIFGMASFNGQTQVDGWLQWSIKSARSFSLLSHSALLNYPFYKLCKINPIFHRGRLEPRQLHKLKHLWIDTVIWYYYKLLQLGSFNSRNDHIFHSQPNGYHTLFVSRHTQKFHLELDSETKKKNKKNPIALCNLRAVCACCLFAKGNYRFITNIERGEI